MKSPAEVTDAYGVIGQNKANLSITNMLLLGFFAGVFIALAAVGANTGGSMIENPGVAKIVSALIFPIGLSMVILAGSELFTGDCLMVITALDKKISWGAMLRCWFFVYIGNFIGSIVVAFVMSQSSQYGLFGNAVAVFTIKTALAKASLAPGTAVILGVFCNFLVCIAVWIGMASTTATEKVAGLYGPIFLFVLCGFEHSVANMYYIPAGLFALLNDTYVAAAMSHGVQVAGLTWDAFFLHNLLPVTLGNIIGGAVFVGVLEWAIYHRK